MKAFDLLPSVLVEEQRHDLPSDIRSCRHALLAEKRLQPPWRRITRIFPKLAAAFPVSAPITATDLRSPFVTGSRLQTPPGAFVIVCA